MTAEQSLTLAQAEYDAQCEFDTHHRKPKASDFDDRTEPKIDEQNEH